MDFVVSVLKKRLKYLFNVNLKCCVFHVVDSEGGKLKRRVIATLVNVKELKEFLLDCTLDILFGQLLNLHSTVSYLGFRSDSIWAF